MSRLGVLIMNTGTPDAPTPEAIRPYLEEFLSDPYIVDKPRWMWLPILHLFILPSRPKHTAEKYQRIWTPEGSPFMVVSRSQERKLQAELERRGHEDVKVVLAMRYGNPSIASGLEQLRDADCDHLLLLPLFPQHARVTTETCLVRAREVLDSMGWDPQVTTVGSYCHRPEYLQALAQSIREVWTYEPGNKLLFSFHSTLVADIDAGDPYRDQAQATSEAVANMLGIPKEDWNISWQCRFDSRDWLQPTPESVLETWATKDVTNVAVVCPVFSADCIETLVDCGAEQKELFESASTLPGARYTYIPALNDSDGYVSVLADVVEDNC